MMMGEHSIKADPNTGFENLAQGWQKVRLIPPQTPSPLHHLKNQIARPLEKLVVFRSLRKEELTRYNASIITGLTSGELLL